MAGWLRRQTFSRWYPLESLVGAGRACPSPWRGRQLRRIWTFKFGRHFGRTSERTTVCWCQEIFTILQCCNYCYCYCALLLLLAYRHRCYSVHVCGKCRVWPTDRCNVHCSYWLYGWWCKGHLWFSAVSCFTYGHS